MSQDLKKQLIKTREVSRILGLTTTAKRNRFLRLLATALGQEQKGILRANEQDCRQAGLDDLMIDRLRLTPERIVSIARDVYRVAALPDPLGTALEKRRLPNGLLLKKQRVPFGVIAVIYESRPNVTVDSVALAVKSGNAVVLKGGEESRRSNLFLIKIIKHCLRQAGLPAASVLYLEKGREAVKEIMAAENYIDVIIPRGGAGLIQFVRKHALVPVIETGAGVCHTYVDASANLEQATRIVHNAKTSRPTVCNALDALLLHRRLARPVLSKLSPLLSADKVTIYADKESYAHLRALHYPYLKPAQPAHFGKEFLGLAMAVKIVPSAAAAIQHINAFGSKHSEAILATNKNTITDFLERVDAACVYANASTRFTDGSQFGLGGEIGISTQKLHARGPLGANELTTYKWIISGQGQIRV